MSKATSGNRAESPRGLPRLPPGRHGLSREYVVQNQRDRIAAGIISTVAANGYHETTITQIAAAAGVSRRTFYAYFPSKEACYRDTYDLIVRHLRSTVREAAEQASGDDEWTETVRAKLAAMLDFFASNPDLARFTLIAPARAGEEIAVHHRLVSERALEELSGGAPAPPAARRPSEAVRQALVGGIVALIVRRVDDDDAEDLPALLPALLELYLTPFLGRRAAVQVARQGS